MKTRLARKPSRNRPGKTPASFSATAVKFSPVFRVRDRLYTLSIARTRAERVEAYRLTFDTYRANGFTHADALPLWYSIHNALPQSITFVVKDERDIAVASGTVIPDSPLGLPMERMYKHEIHDIRQTGRKVCEINSLVSCAGSEGWQARYVILKVFSLAFFYARDILGAEDLLCVTSPQHARFYRRVLLLDQLGPCRMDPHANDAPSVLLRLETLKAEAAFQRKYGSRQGARNLHRFFVPSQDYVASLAAWMRRRIAPLSEKDFKNLFLHTENFLDSLPPDQLDFLQATYPEFQMWGGASLSRYASDAPLAMAV